jgi:hemolysin activation/secretion protein
VVNAKRINENLIERTFAGIIDQPVTAAGAEEHLYLINDIPGVYAQGYFEPGTQVGDTHLKLNVTQEAWFNTSVRLDNHGAKTSGANRVYAELIVHDPSTFGDQLQLGGLRTEEDSSYGSVHYSLPLYTPRLRAKVGASQNDFISRIGDGEKIAGGLEFSGSARVADAEISYHLQRGRQKNSNLNLQFSSIKTQIDVAADSRVVDTTLKNATLSYHFDILNEKSRSLHQLNIGITSSTNADQLLQDFDGEGEDSLLDDKAEFLFYNYSLLSFFKNPFANSDLRVLINHNLQYAGKALVSANKFDLAGPTHARAFDINHFVADDAAHLGADIIFNTPRWLQFGGKEGSSQNGLTPFILTDIAYGQTYPEFTGSQKSTAMLADVGIGLKLNTDWGLRGNLAWATQVANKLEVAEDEVFTDRSGKKNHLYFEFMYSY